MRTLLIAARKAKGMTVADVALALGVSQSFYYKIEAGIRNPNMPLAHRIASLFGGTVDSLFFNQELGELSNGNTTT